MKNSTSPRTPLAPVASHAAKSRRYREADPAAIFAACREVAREARAAYSAWLEHPAFVTESDGEAAMVLGLTTGASVAGESRAG